MTTANNIKDRCNRHNVCRTLRRLAEYLPTQSMDKGLIVFAGVDETGCEILEAIVPQLAIKMFYYNCGDQFMISIANDYIVQYAGNIVFANGDECFIYQYENGAFIQRKHLIANLQKRQKKGGQSALRIARLAEETRHAYVTRVVDSLNLLERGDKTLLYGSKEIQDLILANKQLLQPIWAGGFLDFNRGTIADTKKWCKMLENTEAKNKYDAYYEKVVSYLGVAVDRLDFNPVNKAEMEFYMCDGDANAIPFPDAATSQYYLPLRGFQYIGVKYYEYADERE